MSHTEVIFTLGIVASDCMSLRQRPPVPMQPTVIVSLAAKPFAVAEYPAVIAPAAAMPSDSNRSRREMGIGTFSVFPRQRKTKYVLEMLGPADAVGQEIGVQRRDVPNVKTFACRYKRRVRKIHRNIRVF